MGERDTTAGTEWLTVLSMAGCYVVWIVGGVTYAAGLWPVAIPLMVLATAFHSSLQHETIHGHPTAHAGVNEALVSLPLGLLFPYRRYRDLHLKHHEDAHLTDPLEDPESYFWPLSHYERMRPFMRALFRFNNTFVGRLVIGPSLTIVGFGRTEYRALLRGDAGVRMAWALHVFGVVAVYLCVTGILGMPFWLYFLAVAYPAASLIAMRAYAEHQAAENIGGRTAIVEAHPFWALLYLNNNLHIVHHASPGLPWYDLPKRYRQRRSQYLAANDHLLFDGYREIARRFAFSARQTVDHPFLRRDRL